MVTKKCRPKSRPAARPEKLPPMTNTRRLGGPHWIRADATPWVPRGHGRYIYSYHLLIIRYLYLGNWIQKKTQQMIKKPEVLYFSVFEWPNCGSWLPLYLPVTTLNLKVRSQELDSQGRNLGPQLVWRHGVQAWVTTTQWRLQTATEMPVHPQGPWSATNLFGIHYAYGSKLKGMVSDTTKMCVCVSRISRMDQNGSSFWTMFLHAYTWINLHHP